jgi:hypothetical protein
MLSHGGSATTSFQCSYSAGRSYRPSRRSTRLRLLPPFFAAPADLLVFFAVTDERRGAQCCLDWRRSPPQ